MNESELIKNIQNGDSDSFRKLFELYKNKAVRTAYHITGNQATAEDVAQEAFVKCYYEIGKLQNPECFKTWFYRLLVRTAWRYAEIDKKNATVGDVFEESEKAGKSVEQQYLEAEITSMVYDQIQKLDKKKRTTVMLFYYSELSTKEIAQVMDCLEGTVKSRLHFARKILKRNLEILQLKEDGYYGKAGYQSIL